MEDPIPELYSSGHPSSPNFSQHCCDDGLDLSSHLATQSNHSTFLSNAQNFTINGGHFISAGGSIVMATQGGAISNVDGLKRDIPGLIPGLRAIPYEGLSIRKQLYKGRGYRLHAGRIHGKAVVVKVFDYGRRAKELCIKAARLNRKLMHPSFPQMIAGPPEESESPFIAFEGDFESTLESKLASVLTSDVRESFILGLQTVISTSLGLDYLQDLNYPLSAVGSEHLRLITNSKGDIVIDFDPEISLDLRVNDGAGSANRPQAESMMKLLDDIIKKTFDASCKAHYTVQRTSIDDATIDFEDEPRLSRIEEVEDETNEPTTHIGTASTIGHRRELIWNSKLAHSAVSLDEISQRAQDFLDRYLVTSVINYRRGRPGAEIVHHCRGYQRTEIQLTPDIERSAIVAHTTPIPGEICPVCGKVVEAPSQQIFSQLGSEDSEDGFNMTYCFCDGVSYGEMIACDSDRCEREWFHMACVGLTDVPSGRWYCDDCIGRRRPRRRNTRKW